jgi:hypothetical protein
MLDATAAATVTLTNSGWTVGRSAIGYGQKGAGTITFVAGAGVTIRNVAGDLVHGQQYGTCVSRYTGVNEWTIYGTEPPQLPDGYVTGAMMEDATIGAAKLAVFAVTSPKIADLNVTTGKLADGAVTLAKQANVTGPTALGRVSGTGAPQALTPAQIREVAGLPIASAYTATNVTTDRAFDANATTLDELADVVGTLLADLKTAGVLP